VIQAFSWANRSSRNRGFLSAPAKAANGGESGKTLTFCRLFAVAFACRSTSNRKIAPKTGEIPARAT
jgi:hypothetical protein